MSELFGRLKQQSSTEKAVLVHVNLPLAIAQKSTEQELSELSATAGADACERLVFQRTQIEPKYFIGKGQVDVIRQALQIHEAECVIFNHTLSPSQERNLSQDLNCKIIDRVRLILDIFALRARTHEGKLQVELAQLQHMSTRLIGGWTHLERQKGGIGLRGPGETQLESDRRIIHQRIKQINQRIKKIQSQRDLGRNSRKRKNIPTVVMVGYTNAGKSTLFNQLTDAEVHSADQLFATLDTTLRKLKIDGVGECILADSVGFIRRLPHELIAAFRATLEEVCEADLVLHVIDASDPDKTSKADAVYQVLEEIDATKVPMLIVSNKCELTSAKIGTIRHDDQIKQVNISAIESLGLNDLKRAIGFHLKGHYQDIRIQLSGNYGKFRAQLHELGEVLSEDVTQNGDMLLSLRINLKAFNALKHTLAESEIKYQVVNA